jgi:DUF1680 family protein
MQADAVDFREVALVEVGGMDWTRRKVLAGMAAGAGVAMTGRAAFAKAESALAPMPFAMAEVRLLAGEVKAAAAINERYLDSLATDRLLHSFRLTAGLTSSAAPYGGWEKPDCELRGHFNGGHYLSAVALNFASTGNDELRRRGDTMVAELARCQKANGNGYLSAYPANLFQNLAEGKKVWAPFYTLHKIMGGLLGMYGLTGNEEALRVCEGMAGWVDAYFEGIGDAQRQRMLRIEYGGMNEVLLNLYGVTKKQRYLDMSRLFEQPLFLDALAGHRDELKGLHVNTHVPKVIGAARRYELTGERRYRGIAEYFLDEVLSERCYAIANTSDNEGWTTEPGNLKGTLHYTNAECCVAYNLMKLERKVFGWTGDARWMDAYERQMWNCRMGTQDAVGRKMYYMPMAAGGWKFMGSAEDTFWCCTGTGAEEFAKWNDTIYSHDGESVWVNQFIASELDWKEKKFGLRQETGFPTEQGTTLRVKVAEPQMRTIHIRIPGWVGVGGAVRINGRPMEAFGQPGSYLAITRQWQDGDKIEVALPMTLRAEPLPGDESLQAHLYGPMVLAAVMGDGPKDGPQKIGGYDTRPKELPKGIAAPVLGDVRMESESELRFQGGSMAMKPLYRVVDETFAVYGAGVPG